MMMENGPMMPAEAAALLLAVLEARGATFHINVNGDLRADLDPVPRDRLPGEPEVLIRAILGLAEPIKAILRSRRTVH
jgi:hypothetical protein